MYQLARGTKCALKNPSIEPGHLPTTQPSTTDTSGPLA